MSASPATARPPKKRRQGLPGWLLVSVVTFMAGMFVITSPAMTPLQEIVEQRAAVAIHADFAQPSDGWFGARDWARLWSRDGEAVRIGQLTLYRPSLRLTDYELEFLGEIRGRSLGWVFRAADLRNYYVARLIAARPPDASAPLILERSVVISGDEAHRVQVPVRERFDVRKPVRIAVQASGSDFTILIDGKVVDFFHDDLLPAGGVGFMGEPDDRPRIHWMRVRHHDDVLGKVCAWLSPGVS